jgi:hypothetical protein
MPTMIHKPSKTVLLINVRDADTPAMVIRERRGVSYTATFDCAVNTGELCGTDGEFIDLSPDVVEWLETFTDDVETAYNVARKDNPEYR